MTCSVPLCGREVEAQGWCSGHYQRWYAHGDVRADVPLRKMRVTLEEKFVAGLPDPLPGPSECWEWCGTRSHYGIVTAYKTGNRYAHRIAWERAAGRPIPDRMVVRHTCDNKFCVNPGHLILGAQADNVRDAVDRRLNCRGERHGRRALTEVKVREIKRLLKEGRLSHRKIAELFPEITRSAIEGIASGRTWKWVEAADYSLLPSDVQARTST